MQRTDSQEPDYMPPGFVLRNDALRLLGIAAQGAIGGLVACCIASAAWHLIANLDDFFSEIIAEGIFVAIVYVVVVAATYVGAVLIVSLVVAIPIVCVAGLAGRFVFQDEFPRWYATLVGGWMGATLLSVPLLFTDKPPQSGWVWLAAAVAFGQAGSVRSLRQATERGELFLAPDEHLVRMPRFGMKHLLALSTLACLGGAVATVVPHGDRLVAAFVVATGQQIMAVVAWYARPQRHAAQPQ